ncbi:MAG: hypothetical protein JXN59_13985 [Anaerolineae bacterium]|nr:hypothetical protein [Anaerolineae bacterium]
MTDRLEVEPVAPEEARRRLEAATAPYLADGWTVRVEHDYMAQLTRGRQNLTFYVDLLGQVTSEETRLSPVQESGHVVAWLLLVLAFFLVLTAATAFGWL